MSSAPPPKKPFRKRVRSESDDDSGAPPPTAAAGPRVAPPPGTAPNIFSTSSSRSAPSAAPPAAAAAVVGAPLPPPSLHPSSDAVASRQEMDADGRAALERRLALQAASLAELEAGGPRVYRGAAGYTDFKSGSRDVNEAVAAAKWAGALGPSRAPSNVRGICRVDYAPDICKDWKETGQCPFGDSCIFLHDRSDYKSGWQVELEWQAAQREKQKRLAEVLAAGGTLEDAEAAEAAAAAAAGGAPGGAGGVEKEQLPFACFICRGDFKDPVATSCGHYFCEACAVAHNKASPHCAHCGAPTHGLLHAAPKLRAALEARAARKRAAEGGGEAASGGGAPAAPQKEADEDCGGGGWGDA
jgi:RING finger protein 113A